MYGVNSSTRFIAMVSPRCAASWHAVGIPVALLLLPEDGAGPGRLPAPCGPNGWRLPQANSRNPVVRIAYWISRRRFGRVTGHPALTAHNPLVLAGWGAFELALERADRIDNRLEDLAATRTATMTGCPFCIDFATALLPKLGFTPRQVAEVARWQDSEAFSDDERLVLEYAEAMMTTRVEVTDELFHRVLARFDEAAIVELTAPIALENYRGRLNHALGLGSEGFCELGPTPGRPRRS
jgi:AhpD family alkylhydroperoxidase